MSDWTWTELYLTPSPAQVAEAASYLAQFDDLDDGDDDSPAGDEPPEREGRLAFIAWRENQQELADMRAAQRGIL